MADPIELAPTDRTRLEPLFRERTTLRAVVDAVVEGELGAARADDSDEPRVARLDLGCYAIFGGAADAPAAERLVRSVRRPRELVFPDDDAWRELLHRVHSGLQDRSMRSFSAAGLDAAALAALATRIPPGFEVHPVDAALAARLGPQLEPHAMQVFDDPEDFSRRGLGFCAVRGDAVACAATSYTVCRGRIELAIATHPDFRRLGLARAVAARLMANCLERGITPQWNAANPVSQRLARGLGYRPAELCEVLYLDALEHPGGLD